MNAFQDKVVLISGGSRGVGFAAAKTLAERGARIVITARGEKRLIESRDKLIGMGAEVEAVAGDIGSWDDAKKTVDAALRRFGRLDVVVCNAGVSMRGHFAELSPGVIEQVVRTNLLGAMLLARAAMEPLIESKGSLVFISSIAGLLGVPGAAPYCATKGGLTGLTESLRLELIPKGVHVGVVYLGFTEHDPEKRILAADGSAVPPDRPAHHTQAYAAGLIVDLVAGRKKQIVMTPVGKFAAVVHRLWPGASERVILAAQSGRWKMFDKFS